MANNKGPHGRSIAPTPAEVGRRMERKRKKSHGLGYGQFKKTAIEANSNNKNTDKKNIQNKSAKSREKLLPPNVLHAPELQLTFPGPAPCCGSAAAGNKSATRLPLPPPRCGGEWKETVSWVSPGQG